MGLSLAMLSLGMADGRDAELNKRLIFATALAEGATEIGQQDLIAAATSGKIIPRTGTAVINGHSATYNIEAVGTTKTVVDKDGLESLLQAYSVSADGVFDGCHRRVEKIVEMRKFSLLQFTIFYNKDLEMIPGPTSLTMYGRFHTNADMYLGGGNMKLESDYVRAAGHIYRRELATGAPTDGKVRITIKDTKTYEEMESKKSFGAPSTSGFDSSFLGYDANHDGDFNDKGDYHNWTQGALDIWDGTVMSAEHGVKAIQVPPIDTIDDFVPATGGSYVYNSATNKYVPVAPGAGTYAKGFYHGQAGLSVMDGKVYDAGGVEITSWGANNPISTSTFYDAVTAKNITVTNIDLAKLGASGKWPANGLLYASRTDATASRPDGIRLKNGDVLAAPLTVVSQNPVYVWGDYNVGNKSNPKRPAAVFTDSFNVLSDKWTDSATPRPLPKSSPTSVNVALITATPSAASGKYNGDFESLIRWHEDWNGNQARIMGSFVNLWDSKIDQSASLLSAHDHFWDYDKDLRNSNLQPPFAPCIVVTNRVVWVSR